MDIRKNCYIKYALFSMIITVLILSLIVVPIIIEPDIHQATYKELIEITGVGEHKANLILSYLESNKEAEISDLEELKGIGEILVERIEKVYR